VSLLLGDGRERKEKGRGREKEVEFPHLFNPTLTTDADNKLTSCTE